MSIERARPVDIRTAWPREDQDLTPWLAENLDIFEEIGLGQLDLLGTEVPLPGFKRRLDVLAETADERLVAIENQYRAVDHDHLTRGLAYAVGLDACALVVVAEDHGDEFVAVADYLNDAYESMNDQQGIAIFLVSLKVDQVGNYLVPRLEMKARPNLWLAEIRKTASDPELTQSRQDRREQRRLFWVDLAEAARASGSDFWIPKDGFVHQYLTITAISGANVTWNITNRRNDSSAFLWIDYGDSERNSRILYELRDRIGDSPLPFELEWLPKENARSCSIVTEPVPMCGWGSTRDERVKALPELLTKAEALKEVFEPHLEDVIRSTE